MRLRAALREDMLVVRRAIQLSRAAGDADWLDRALEAFGAEAAGGGWGPSWGPIGTQDALDTTPALPGPESTFKLLRKIWGAVMDKSRSASLSLRSLQLLAESWADLRRKLVPAGQRDAWTTVLRARLRAALTARTSHASHPPVFQINTTVLDNTYVRWVSSADAVAEPIATIWIPVDKVSMMRPDVAPLRARRRRYRCSDRCDGREWGTSWQHTGDTGVHLKRWKLMRRHTRLEWTLANFRDRQSKLDRYCDGRGWWYLAQVEEVLNSINSVREQRLLVRRRVVAFVSKPARQRRLLPPLQPSKRGKGHESRKRSDQPLRPLFVGKERKRPYVEPWLRRPCPWLRHKGRKRCPCKQGVGQTHKKKPVQKSLHGRLAPRKSISVNGRKEEQQPAKTSLLPSTVQLDQLLCLGRYKGRKRKQVKPPIPKLKQVPSKFGLNLVYGI